MLRLRVWISLFVLWLILFFNLERAAEAVNLASFVYVYVPVMSIIVLIFPQFVKIFSEKIFVLLILTLFFLQKLIFGYDIAGPHLPITITEIVSIFFAYVMAKKISLIVSDFEDTVGNLTFQQIGLPPRLYETTDTEDLYREVKRCRRFQHPLALLIIQNDFDPNAIKHSKILEEMQKTFSARYAQTRLAKLYSDKVRDTDLVVIKKDEIVLLLPETSQDGAESLLNELRKIANDDLNLNLSCGMSMFPDSAVTLNGLMEMAYLDLEQNKT